MRNVKIVTKINETLPSMLHIMDEDADTVIRDNLQAISLTKKRA